jgi:thiamine pyrophosphate-dependent acetolactate synthase large subunit-like protein
MKVYEVVAEGLLEQGVTTVFALMTSDTMTMLGLLESKGIRIIRSRTELGAVSMADGFARATSEVGVVSIGAGPSAAMTGTALVTARKRRSRLVLIAGDTPLGERHHLKRFDQHGFFQLTAGHCLSAVDTSNIVPDTYEVFRRARSGAGPAVMNVPVDILEGDIDYELVVAQQRYMLPSPEVVPVAAPESVEAAARLLANARRPVIVVGRGASDPRTRELVLAIGERIGALYGSSLQGQGMIGGPFDVGIIGTLGTGSAIRAMSETDCALVVGASLNSYTGGHGQFFHDAKVIQIDRRPEAFGAETPIDIGLCGEAATTLAALDAQLRSADPHSDQPHPGFRTVDWVDEIVADLEAVAEYEPVTEVLDQRLVLDRISAALPVDVQVVVDAGHFAFFVIDHIRLGSPAQRIWTADFASIGLAVPIGVGAAAASGVPTVVFVGDGGFAMSLNELDTAVRHGIPLTVVVMDDGAYGAEVRYLENRREPDHLARFASPSWADIATAYGCASATVRTVAELEAVLHRIGRTDGPFVLDIKVDSTVANRQFRGRTTSAAGAR